MKRHKSTNTRIVVLLFGCVMLTGCGGEQRLDFSGTATFAGDPIVYGSVVFVPDGAAGHKGPTGIARIVNGRFDTGNEGGQGVLPGKHIIRVTAYPSEPPANEDETIETTPLEPLFLDWQTEADLTTATFDIVVPEDARGFKPAGDSRPPSGGNEP